MKKAQEQLKNLFIIIDLLIIIGSYLLSWYLIIYSREDISIGVLPQEVYFRALIFIAPIYLILYAIFGLYSSDERNHNIFDDIIKIIEGNIIGLLVINTVLFVGSKNPYFSNFSRIMIFSFGAINVALDSLIRIIIRSLVYAFRKKGFNQKHILLVGYSDASFKFIDKVFNNPGWGYSIYGIVDDIHKINDDYRNVKIVGRIDDLENIISKNDFSEIAITLSLSEYDKLRKVVSICEKSGLHTKFIPDYGTMIPSRPQTDDFDGLPVINIRAVPLQGFFNSFIKRTMDIIGSILAIVLFSPIMLIIAIIIKLTSFILIIISCFNMIYLSCFTFNIFSKIFNCSNNLHSENI